MSASLGGIAGRVLAADGTPAAGATVAIVGGAQAHQDIAAIAAGDGRFRLGRLAPGHYRVEARAKGKSAAADVVVQEGADAEVEMRFDE